MRILYGIQLNGNGHITRSNTLIKKLKEIGHNVDIITSGNNSNLEVKSKYHFDGFSLISNSGSIDWVSTIYKSRISNIKNVLIDVSSYDLVISDFEPISAWSAKKCGIECIGISNQYNLFKQRFNLAKIFIKLFTPCSHFIGIDYLDSDDIYQPFIPESIVNGNVSNDKSIVIYLPSLKCEYITSQIKKFNYKFIIYTSEDLESLVSYKNIEYKNIGKSFIEDILKCDSIITASGFSTTSEALILGKKVWSIPIKGHYEQKTNANKLKNMGIFTSKFNERNFYKWFTEYKKIEYKWEDPINNLLLKIKEIYEKN